MHHEVLYNVCMRVILGIAPMVRWKSPILEEQGKTIFEFSDVCHYFLKLDTFSSYCFHNIMLLSTSDSYFFLKMDAIFGKISKVDFPILIRLLTHRAPDGRPSSPSIHFYIIYSRKSRSKRNT